MLKNLPHEDMKAICAIGDRGFDSIEIMEYLYNKGITAAIAVNETFRMGVRDELRKMSKEAYKLYGRNRYLIESLYGTVKQSIGNHLFCLSPITWTKKRSNNYRTPSFSLLAKNLP